MSAGEVDIGCYGSAVAMVPLMRRGVGFINCKRVKGEAEKEIM